MNTNEMEYNSFLNMFLNTGYRFVGYNDFKHGEDRQIILRHDIDFDTGLAAQMAELETSYKIKSTYFYWLTNNFYNILFKETFEDIEYVLMNHHIKIHFNIDNYDDFNKRYGLKTESWLFNILFNKNIDSLEPFSIHKPTVKSLHEYLGTTDHTYKKRWFRDIKYISDSKGFFREGNPFVSDWFKQGKSVQCAIHPIWWMQEGKEVIDKLNNWIVIKTKQLIINVSNTCKTYKDCLRED